MSEEQSEVRKKRCDGSHSFTDPRSHVSPLDLHGLIEDEEIMRAISFVQTLLKTWVID
jgi:hypothetical protein